MNGTSAYIVREVAPLFATAVQNASGIFDSFFPQFEQSNRHRGQISLQQYASSTELRDVLLKFAPTMRIDVTETDVGFANKLNTISVFGCDKRMTYIGTEYSEMATLRYQMSGTRKWGSVSYADVCSYMEGEGKTIDSYDAAQKFIEGLDTSGIDKFVGTKEGCMVFGLALPGSVTYVPAGSIVFETVLQDRNVSAHLGLPAGSRVTCCAPPKRAPTCRSHAGVFSFADSRRRRFAPARLHTRLARPDTFWGCLAWGQHFLVFSPELFFCCAHKLRTLPVCW